MQRKRRPRRRQVERACRPGAGARPAIAAQCCFGMTSKPTCTWCAISPCSMRGTRSLAHGRQSIVQQGAWPGSAMIAIQCVRNVVRVPPSVTLVRPMPRVGARAAEQSGFIHLCEVMYAFCGNDDGSARRCEAGSGKEGCRIRCGPLCTCSRPARQSAAGPGSATAACPLGADQAGRGGCRASRAATGTSRWVARGPLCTRRSGDCRPVRWTRVRPWVDPVLCLRGGKAASRLTTAITRRSLLKVPRRCLARRRHTVASRPSSRSLPGTYARKRLRKKPGGLGNWGSPKRVWMRRWRW